MTDYQSIGLLRLFEIAELINMDRKSVAKRIKSLGLVPIDKWHYDQYQIELIKDYETTPRVKYEIIESKMNEI